MTTNIPRRPAWNSTDVKTEAALEIVEDVRSWAIKGGLIADDASEKEFNALVVIAVRESPDSYQAGRYFEDFYEWPVDRDLIAILDVAYRRMPFLATKHVHQWVMKHKVRFPAKKGEGVVYRIGDVEVGGQVKEVLRREARAIVLPTKGSKHLSVPAEEVLRTFKINAKGPNDFPTGPGTPAQARAKKMTGTDG